MRRRGVLSVLVGCSTLLAIALPGLGTASAAPPAVTIAGSLPAPVAGPGTETLDYTMTVTAAIDGAVLTATEPADMTADPATVQVNGVDAPVGTVSQQGDGLVIRLGAGADGAQGGTLTVGAYLITFDIAVPATVPPNSTASASLAFTRSAVPDSATSNTVALSGPDLASVDPAQQRRGSDPAARHRADRLLRCRTHQRRCRRDGCHPHDHACRRGSRSTQVPTR